MAQAYKTGFTYLAGEEEFDSVICMGGAAQKNGALRAVIENVFRRPCLLPENADEVLSGLLKIAERAAAARPGQAGKE